MRKIKRLDQSPGGYEVTVEVASAYKNGESRFDKVYVTADEVEGKTREEALTAIKCHAPNGLRSLRGADLDEPVPETKAVLEARLRQQIYDVSNLIVVRNEAEALGRPQSEIDAWTTLRNAQYQNALETLEAWNEARG